MHAKYDLDYVGVNFMFEVDLKMLCLLEICLCLLLTEIVYSSCSMQNTLYVTRKLFKN